MREWTPLSPDNHYDLFRPHFKAKFRGSRKGGLGSQTFTFVCMSKFYCYGTGRNPVYQHVETNIGSLSP
jgi:hypothetical protein